MSTQRNRMLASLAGMLVLALGLGAFAYFGVFEAEREEQARQETEAKLLGMDAGEIRRIELRTDGGTTTLVREGEDWRITSPVEARADADEVNRLVDRIAGARRKRLLDGGEPASLGLEPARLVLAAEDGSGRRLEVALGTRNSFDGSIYVRDASGRIALAEGSLFDALRKETFDLRDKRVVVVGSDTLERIRLEKAVLARRDGAWWIEEPFQLRADGPTVDQIVRAIQDLRALDFVDEKPEDLARWGLDRPAATVRLERGELEPIEIRFGEVDKKVYARAGEGPVVQVLSTILSSLRKEPAELRDKRVLDVKSSQVEEVRFSGEGGEYRVVRRTDENGASRWLILDGESEIPAKGWKVSSLVSTLSTLRAEEFEEGKPADFGLEPPRRTVTFVDGSGQELGTLEVGRKEGAQAWVRAAGSDRIARIRDTQLSHLPDTRADLEEEPAAEAKADEAD